MVWIKKIEENINTFIGTPNTCSSGMPSPTAVPSYKVIEIDAKTNPKGIVRLISADKTSFPFVHKK